jgi:uncharacterized protein YjaZ
MFDLLEAQELTNSSTHKNMAKTTKKRSKMLVEFINQINATNLVLQDKQTETQNKIPQKQLQYCKTKTQDTSNEMVKTFNNLTQVVTMAFTQGATNNKEYTQ